MSWEEHAQHPSANDSRLFYTYALRTPDNEEYYAAYVIHNDNGYQATVPYHIEPEKSRDTKYYHYTHDTLQEAKDWCIAELWKRRLDQ
jgi:hypothetical protein